MTGLTLICPRFATVQGKVQFLGGKFRSENLHRTSASIQGNPNISACISHFVLGSYDRLLMRRLCLTFPLPKFTAEIILGHSKLTFRPTLSSCHLVVHLCTRDLPRSHAKASSPLAARRNRSAWDQPRLAVRSSLSTYLKGMRTALKPYSWAR